MAVKAVRSFDSDNVADVVCPNFIHTTCSQSMQSVFLMSEISFKQNLLPA